MLATFQHTHTHTETHWGPRRSEVSEPVRGLRLDAAPEQAGQKHGLSPLVKWFNVPCSRRSFHRRPTGRADTEEPKEGGKLNAKDL